jgi:hypothetical protein
MSDEWLEREAVVTVKAYPNPSSKYFESVCVAAITREEGAIRLYPVGFRSLPAGRRFKKYQRIKFKMRKHERDRRPESFRPDEHSFELLETLNSANGWKKRWDWVRPTIGPSMCELMTLQASERRSLGCIRPRDVDKLIIEDADAEWSGSKKGTIDQLALFDNVETKLERIPFVFKYRYRCESPACKGHNQSIIDWELMELYRKVRQSTDGADDIKAKIRQKYLDQLCGSDKDTHFFVGNHSLYPVSFMVLGIFWPPKATQHSLF